MTENQKISIIVRTIKGRKDFLDQCLFSLYCSDYKNDLEVIIVCQTSDLEYFDSIQDLQFLYERNNLKFKYIINPVDFDDRANNLNLGVKACTGRYICFLDDDDIYYPNHISLLFSELSNSDKVWAYSNCCMHHNNGLVMENKTLPFNRSQFSFLDLWKDNYIPIHSWLIDKERIKIPIYFDTNLSKLEDYLFLLNLAFNHEPVFVNKITHVYKVRNDGSNTIPVCKPSA